jgi:BRCT domain type II-containing protein
MCDWLGKAEKNGGKRQEKEKVRTKEQSVLDDKNRRRQRII